MRLLCLLFPRLTIQLARRQAGYDHGPLLVVSGEGDNAVIAATSPEIAAAGARPGMLASSARGRWPHAMFAEERPGTALTVLDHVAAIVRRRATPFVAIGGIDHLFVDLAGLDGSVASEDAAAAAFAGIARAWTGCEVRAGVAGTRHGALAAARHARGAPIVTESALCEPMERIPAWRDDVLSAEERWECEIDAAGARRKLLRLLSRLQSVLDTRNEGFRSVTLEVATDAGAQVLRAASIDPHYRAADALDLLGLHLHAELFEQSISMRVTFASLSPDVRVPVSPVHTPAGPAALVAPVRPIQRRLLRAG